MHELIGALCDKAPEDLTCITKDKSRINMFDFFIAEYVRQQVFEF